MVSLIITVIYISFISLGLPDSLLGAAWPTVYVELGVPVSYAGAISMIISVGTVISSLQSDRLTKKLGAGKVTVISVGMTAAALFGFSFSSSFWMLCLWAIPYGLGAGSVDASLNNYIAVHFTSRHMSWLHCMWGVGASVGPYLMSWALLSGRGWSGGYRAVGFIQITLTAVLLFTLPLWKERQSSNARSNNNKPDNKPDNKPLTLRQVLAIPDAKAIMLVSFCYCSAEHTAGLWASSYLVLDRGLSPETAASFASMFYLGITAGRALSGFITIKLNDTAMIRLGQIVAMSGVLTLLFTKGEAPALVGLVLMGLGCAPIYPCILHSTPERFGAERSQALIGVQMASAHVGVCLMPPLFGLIADHISVSMFPVFLLVVFAVMAITHERLDANAEKTKRVND